MKKTFFTLILLVVLGLSAGTVLAQFFQPPPAGQTPDACCVGRDLTDIHPACDPGNVYGGCVQIDSTAAACCLIDTIYRVADWLFFVIVALVFIFFLVGAYYLISSGGSPDKVNTGRNYILFSLIGIIVAFLAQAAPGIAKAIIGATRVGP